MFEQGGVVRFSHGSKQGGNEKKRDKPGWKDRIPKRTGKNGKK